MKSPYTSMVRIIGYILLFNEDLAVFGSFVKFLSPKCRGLFIKWLSHNIISNILTTHTISDCCTKFVLPIIQLNFLLQFYTFCLKNNILHKENTVTAPWLPAETCDEQKKLPEKFHLWTSGILHPATKWSPQETLEKSPAVSNLIAHTQPPGVLRSGTMMTPLGTEERQAFRTACALGGVEFQAKTAVALF